METLFTLSFPAKAHTNQKLHSGQQATKGRKSGKKKKKVPRRTRARDRPVQPLPSPKAAGQGERAPAAEPPGPQKSCGPGGRSTFLPSPTRAPVFPGRWEVKRAEWGSLGECPEPGGTQFLGMGTQRGKGNLQERRVKTNLRRKRVQTGEGGADSERIPSQQERSPGRGEGESGCGAEALPKREEAEEYSGQRGLDLEKSAGAQRSRSLPGRSV